MILQPEPQTFKTCYRAGRPQVAWATLADDLETPVSAMLKLAADDSNAFLLESVEGGSRRNRYSFIGMKPDLIWRCFGNRAEINRNALSTPGVFVPESAPTLESLKSLEAESRIDLPHSLPPMAAGLFGYMGYDTVRLVEKIPGSNPDTLHTPDGIFLRPTVMAIFDSIGNTITIITPVRPCSDVSAETARNLAEARLRDVISALTQPLSGTHGVTEGRTDLAEPVSSTGRRGYHEMVETAKEYIRAGDIFQVVPSQRFSVPFDLPPFALYRALRRTNPSPFLFYLNFSDHALVGSSPEILVRCRGGKVTIRPIAGTRPRGKTEEEDRALAEDLLSDPKECAEHLMLLDLGRNDVGKVAAPGTVTVTQRMHIEEYSHVMHIVSNVEGELQTGMDAMDAMMAGFPAGTVTGAPKIRAMEIIDELEGQKRGFYAGTIGYLSANGEMDSCIALRTGLVKDGKLHYQAGGGVVADSDPESEYQESCNKARALLTAAEEAARFV